MKNTPILWIQRENKKPIWDFSAIAHIGGIELGWKVKFFEDYIKIPFNKYNVLIGSVEQLTEYLHRHNIEIPSAIDILKFSKKFTKREMYIQDSKFFLEENKKWPVFVKPYDKIKYFTGTQLSSEFDTHLVLNKINCNLCVQEVIDPIISEWRLFVNKGVIIELKHYLGNSLIFPSRDFIVECLLYANQILDYKSYTLDFGVAKINGDVQTFLIEANDGWAIGSYGLEPSDYVKFCRDRWWEIQNKKTF